MYTVTYLHHSGVLIETENFCLLFDYYNEKNQNELFLPEQHKTKKLYIFVSHSHPDHFDNTILKWRDSTPNIHYILSDDITLPSDFPKQLVTYVTAHKEYSIGDIKISTLLSNDEGVAFVVDADGMRFFHAGDLNWWHWNGESEQFNYDIAKSYQSEILRICGTPIHTAFIPVDPRLEENYSLALDYLMRTVDVSHVFPIHFWGQFSVCTQLKNDPCTSNYRQKIVEINSDCEKFEFE